MKWALWVLTFTCLALATASVLTGKGDTLTVGTLAINAVTFGVLGFTTLLLDRIKEGNK